MNLLRYNIQASPLEERGVPVIVPLVQEPIMGSRMKEGHFLKKLKFVVSIITQIEKSDIKRLPPPQCCVVLGGSARSSAPAAGVAPSYEK